MSELWRMYLDLTIKNRILRSSETYEYRSAWEATKNIKLSKEDKEYLEQALKDIDSVSKEELDAITERAMQSIEDDRGV